MCGVDELLGKSKSVGGSEKSDRGTCESPELLVMVMLLFLPYLSDEES
jgi:hypothetical protein